MSFVPMYMFPGETILILLLTGVATLTPLTNKYKVFDALEKAR